VVFADWSGATVVEESSTASLDEDDKNTASRKRGAILLTGDRTSCDGTSASGEGHST